MSLKFGEEFQESAARSSKVAYFTRRLMRNPEFLHSFLYKISKKKGLGLVTTLKLKRKLEKIYHLTHLHTKTHTHSK